MFDLLNKAKDVLGEVSEKVDAVKGLNLADLSNPSLLLDQISKLDFAQAKEQLLGLIPNLPVDKSQIAGLVEKLQAAVSDNDGIIQQVIDKVKELLRLS